VATATAFAAGGAGGAEGLIIGDLDPGHRDGGVKVGQGAAIGIAAVAAERAGEADAADGLIVGERAAGDGDHEAGRAHRQGAAEGAAADTVAILDVTAVADAPWARPRMKKLESMVSEDEAEEVPGGAS
jgi:hypothetical protein